ncbi:recombinase RecB [Planosporangium flavigriseum]|uniref:Recombinase RecB n=1 Tax=Planosporangium flavigriseum TaxID=373681 RepID=A0A8J3LIM9_9ACTN|nr:recombinase RecB [Planosporangium flavigriseum]
MLLGGYAAKTCPRATHNEYDITVPRPEVEVSPELQRLFDLGRDFENDVFAQWIGLDNDGLVDLRDYDHDKYEHIDATLRAMEYGVPVILGGRLPDDPDGGRTGKPDILLRETDGPGYHPADVKAHFVLDKRETGGLVTCLHAPALANATALSDHGLRYREPDLLQLAHFWRMLEVCGYQAESPYGAICGNDQSEDPLLAWYDLTEPLFRTFSRSQGAVKRSALERYDHEHGFRLDVAKAAVQRKGSVDDPEPLVVPIGQQECDECVWASVCVDMLPASDLSGGLRGALSVREYAALRDAGIGTIEQLAAKSAEDLLTDGYLQDTAHLTRRASRLRQAIISAQLARDDAVLRVKPETTIDLPKADIEIDLDIEWSADNQVYLWGALLTSEDDSRYVSFFDPAAVEADLARRCLAWLRDIVTSAREQGRSLLVFHYSHAERTHARRILSEEDWILDSWVDLLPYVRDSIDSRYGHGLKVVAYHGAGFSWRDEDPGGRQSQIWYEQAVHGDAAAAARLLAYNEDDVRASLAVRRWLRGIGQGSGNPDQP